LSQPDACGAIENWKIVAGGKRRGTNENPGRKGRGFDFSGVDFSIVVAVVIAMTFLDHDHIVAVVIAAPTAMIAIIVAILHAYAGYADSNFLGLNGAANDRRPHECRGDK